MHQGRGQHLIGIEALDVSPASDGLVGDAAQVTGEAMAELAARPDGKRCWPAWRRWPSSRRRLQRGRSRRRSVTITVVPSQGLAGRPSSQRIMRAIGRATDHSRHRLALNRPAGL